jgi:uncharacterized protein (TIGR02145 family)
MKKIQLINLLILAIALKALGQSSPLELTFTAVNNIHYEKLDSVKVINKTQPSDTVLYWPDTVLSLLWVGIEDINPGMVEFMQLQCIPNPVIHEAKIILRLQNSDNVCLTVSDLSGKTLQRFSKYLNRGEHIFTFFPGRDKMYILSATNSFTKKHIKVINLNNHKSSRCALKYGKIRDGISTKKSTEKSKLQSPFLFNPGDNLLLKGFVNGVESGILDAPDNSKLYVFQFAANMPCPGTPTVYYQGRTYHTVQILSQCWMSQNLNAGVKINGDLEQTDNGMIERYCLYNSLDSCEKYGGLYQWTEMMAYGDEPGCQGICPQGWHLPTQEEWKLLEGVADSEFGIGNSEWDNFWTMRGTDAGHNLKSRGEWIYGGNGVNSYGFNALPGGHLSQYHFFGWERRAGDYWTSSKALNNTAWYIDFVHNSDKTGLSNHFYNWAFSVRCIKD